MAAKRTPVRGHLRNWVKFWMPAGLVELYRRRRRERTLEEMYAAARDVQFLLPKRELGEIFPGIESVEITVPASQIFGRHKYTLPLAELLTLGAICKYLRPRRIFEFGTYTGSSTLVMAANCLRETEIFTLDLDPATEDRVAFTVGALYQHTPFARQIHQFFGNSLTFDYSPLYRSIDLVLVDANHRYAFVKSDAANSFRLLQSGGVIIWDDYVWDERHPEAAGVAQYLTELVTQVRCFQVSGTRFAIYIDHRQTGCQE